eukprot:TRINITY_DN779948_c0_g1_i1.p1 TRINITY_DN779948_c0_g1~~TRINITY_DN779948_c0_g1_i1.p1  ORF type:complete len:322 (-),score=48.09 TRINITY_DN779948_c0_g1_i1:137-1102(-)
MDKQIFTYQAPWVMYGLAWSVKSPTFRIGIGSFIQDVGNTVHIVEKAGDELRLIHELPHPFPITKMEFIPDETSKLDLIATGSECLRIWEMKKGEPVESRAEFKRECEDEQTLAPPMTSMSWNRVDPRLICSSHSDGTLCIWDVDKGNEKPLQTIKGSMQSIYDVEFTTENEYVAVGEACELYLFDIRKPSTATIVYESKVPLTKVRCNYLDDNYIALIAEDCPDVIVIDKRMSARPTAELRGGTGPVNGISWAPHSAAHMVSVSDDCHANIWDISGLPNPVTEPLMCYSADSEITNVFWSKSEPYWMAITLGRRLQLLRV